MNRLLLSIDDLDDGAVRSVLDRATAFAGSRPEPLVSGPHVVGLIFLEPSLRTRVGFAAAALRLGWQSIDVVDQRASPTSMPESWEDTVRTVSGYVDAVVARPGRPLVRAELAGHIEAPLINGGDTGPAAEHPSQALIDMFAIERLGPVPERNIAICGDLRMRAVRSLLRLLSRTPPRTLVLISDPGLQLEGTVPPELAPVAQWRRPWEIDDIDVLYVGGIPHGALPESGRTMLRVDDKAMARLPGDAVVLSPLPVIDEIAREVRNDPRLRVFEQSDGGLFVRMALLQALVTESDRGGVRGRIPTRSSRRHA